MQFLRVFQYLGVITALITFIQQAQDAFRDRSGAGEEKKNMVLPLFTALVQQLQGSGLIDQRVAGAIIAGASILIDATVLILKGAGLLGGNDAGASATTTAPVQVSGVTAPESPDPAAV